LSDEGSRAYDQGMKVGDIRAARAISSPVAAA
jgi:hypothetical protein